MILNRSSFRYFPILLLLLFLFSYPSNSQTDSVSQKKWGVGIYAGEFFPNELAPINSSNNISIELSYKVSRKLDMFLSGKYNFIKNDNFNDFNLGYLKRENPFFYELNLGCRYYFNNSSPLCFGEVTAGYYNLNKQILNEFWEVENINLKNFELNAGFGLDLLVFKSVCIISKLGYSFLFTNHPVIYNIAYFDLIAGLKYIF